MKYDDHEHYDQDDVLARGRLQRLAGSSNWPEARGTHIIITTPHFHQRKWFGGVSDDDDGADDDNDDHYDHHDSFFPKSCEDLIHPALHASHYSWLLSIDQTRRLIGSD